MVPLLRPAAVPRPRVVRVRLVQAVQRPGLPWWARSTLPQQQRPPRQSTLPEAFPSQAVAARRQPAVPVCPSRAVAVRPWPVAAVCLPPAVAVSRRPVVVASLQAAAAVRPRPVVAAYPRQRDSPGAEVRVLRRQVAEARPLPA
ncbi:hypothetical protein [Mycolicibacterium lacusdiani]|uniref:hypothetical protein n=1 Tax=Mycolicibacterium lacusdiani TaxID=2895283 RepID=UPI001F17858B|nr:hypothetical protein [Mycolicibacterium lacusdiani]